MAKPAATEEKLGTDKKTAGQKDPLVAPAASGARNLKGRLLGSLMLLLVIAGLLFSLYIYIRLHWTYSDGERSGMLQKFSRKGWICKTYEGEVLTFPTGMPGAATVPQTWEFTVRDEDVAKQINAALGHKVVLHYQQHPEVPTSCFGETDYYVDAVRVLER